MELHPPLHLHVVTIEKGAFGSLLTKVANFTYIGLVSLFNGISTFMGYFMPEPSMYKNNNDTIYLEG